MLVLLCLNIILQILHKQTKENPEWVHFGGGNIFRVFIASALQDAIENGKADTGIVVCRNLLIMK